MSTFDAYKDSYREEVERSIGFVGQGLDYFTRTKARLLLYVAQEHLGPAGRLSALDVGCGTGETDQFLQGSFGAMFGVDPSAASIERARERNPDVDYRVGDGGDLPLDDDCVDLAFAICVFHHVPPWDRRGVVSEMRRVVRPGGLVAILEHNPYNALTRRAVSNCVFDRDAVLLKRRETALLLESAGLDVCDARYIVFSPWGGDRVAALERRLKRVPMGAQYCVVAQVPVSEPC